MKKLLWWTENKEKSGGILDLYILLNFLSSASNTCSESQHLRMFVFVVNFVSMWFTAITFVH